MTKKGTIFSLLFSVVTVIAMGLWYSPIVSSPSNKSYGQENIYSPCETTKDKGEVYGCYKDTALYALQNGLSVEDLNRHASDSHLKQHSVGRAMLLVSGYNLERTSEKCTGICTGPHYHGISEEWGEYAPSRADEIIDFLRKVCSLDEPGRASCYHAVGHFHLSVNKNFDESMTQCDALENYDMFSECVLGVVHEQLIQFGTKNFFELCSKYSDRRMQVCYRRGSLAYPKWLSGELTTGNEPLNICNDLNEKIPLGLNHCYASAAWVLESKGITLDHTWCEGLDKNFKELCERGLDFPKPFSQDPASCSIGGASGEESIRCGS